MTSSNIFSWRRQLSRGYLRNEKRYDLMVCYCFHPPFMFEVLHAFVKVFDSYVILSIAKQD